MFPIFSAQFSGLSGIFAPQFGSASDTGLIGARSRQPISFGINFYGTRR